MEGVGRARKKTAVKSKPISLLSLPLSEGKKGFGGRKGGTVGKGGREGGQGREGQEGN